MSETFQHRVGVLAELPDLLRVLGVDPERTISGAGIEPELLQDTEYRLPFGADSGKRRTAEARVARYWAVATPSHDRSGWPISDRKGAFREDLCRRARRRITDASSNI